MEGWWQGKILKRREKRLDKVRVIVYYGVVKYCVIFLGGILVIRKKMFDEEKAREDARRRLDDYYARPAESMVIGEVLVPDLHRIGKLDVRNQYLRTLEVRDPMPNFKATFNSPWFNTIIGAVNSEDRFVSKSLEGRESIRAMIKDGKDIWTLSTSEENLFPNDPVNLKVCKFVAGKKDVLETETKMDFKIGMGTPAYAGGLDNRQILECFGQLVDRIKREGKLPDKMNLVVASGVLAM